MSELGSADEHAGAREPEADNSALEVDPGPPAPPSLVVRAQVVYEDQANPKPLLVTHALGRAFAIAAKLSLLRADDFALSFWTILVALVVDDNWRMALREAVDPDARDDFEKLVERQLRMNEAQISSIFAAIDEDSPVTFTEPLPATFSVHQAFTGARSISNAQGRPPAAPLDCRHVVGAFLSLPGFHEPDFRDIRVDRQRAGRRYVARLLETHPKEASFWRPFARAFATASFAGFDADAYSQDDLLGIEGDVNALASVISSVNTSPPLAMGLFGDWGSGKSFFMRHLRRRIELLTKTAREKSLPQHELGTFKYIAQVEFNAWHYRGDLWASLVDHIFQNLALGEDDEEAALEQRRNDWLSKLGVAEERIRIASVDEAAAAALVADKQNELKALEAEQEKKRAELASSIAAADVVQVVRSLTLPADIRQEAGEILGKLGVADAGESAEAVAAAVSHARSDLSGVGALLLPLLHADDRKKRLVLLTAALVTPPLLGLAIHFLGSDAGHALLGQIGGVVVAVASLLGGIARWIGRQADWLADMRRQLTPVARQIDMQLADARTRAEADLKQELKGHVDALETLRLQYVERSRQLETAVRAADDIQRELARTSTANRLRSFLEERFATDEYRKHLGLEALIRRDFEKLSRLITLNNKRLLAKPRADGETSPSSGAPDRESLNRVVLYIDDLDRCSEDRVVAVLEAVHLLLAFDLFVVVVGVDSRWVARCLRHKHKELLDTVEGDDDDVATVRVATPLNYLEKIFQIPVWLRPLEPGQRVSMARTLFGPAATEAISREVRGQFTHVLEAGVEDETHHAVFRSPRDRTNRENAAAARSAPWLAAPELDPPGLAMTEAELAFLDDLAQLLTQSPRAIKRFVNTYRLLKVSLPPELLDSFYGELTKHSSAPAPPPFEICMFQLTVFVSQTDASSVLLSLSQDDDRPFEICLREVGLHAPGQTAQDAVERVAEWVRARSGPNWPMSLVSTHALWVPYTAHFTFQVGNPVLSHPIVRPPLNPSAGP